MFYREYVQGCENNYKINKRLGLNTPKTCLYCHVALIIILFSPTDSSLADPVCLCGI